MTVRPSVLFAAVAFLCIGVTAGACSSRRPMTAPWCFTSGETGSMYCEFESLGQCEATLSGLGGVCGPNPRIGRERRGRQAPASRRG